MRGSLLVCVAAGLAVSLACKPAGAQDGTPRPAVAAATPAVMPEFEVATVKPSDLRQGGLAGFYVKGGGRVYVGFANLRLLLALAFDVSDYQIRGGPEWMPSRRFQVEAVPPESSPSRSAPPNRSQPTPDERLMLQSLLRDRFALQYHWETQQGPVYRLERGKKPLLLTAPGKPDEDSRANIVSKGGIYDGQAFGQNVAMRQWAERLAGLLKAPVLDETGLGDRYDFQLPATDAENTDVVDAVFSVVDRLGLQLKRDKGAVKTLVVDQAKEPTAN